MYVPNAGQPVSSQAKHTHQQNQNGGTILDVVVQFAGHSAQTQEPDNLQRAEQAANALRGADNGKGKYLFKLKSCTLTNKGLPNTL